MPAGWLRESEWYPGLTVTWTKPLLTSLPGDCDSEEDGKKRSEWLILLRHNSCVSWEKVCPTLFTACIQVGKIDPKASVSMLGPQDGMTVIAGAPIYS